LSTVLIFSIIVIYFGIILTISYLTSRNSSDESFFTGDRESPWFLVAFGMVGAALSGVTFVSVPGMVGNNNFYFFQFILGNILGYLFITFVLIPLYYRLKLVSIYGYLNDRFGNTTKKTGSLFFLVSQSFGAALRLLLAAKILQFAFFDRLDIPFIDNLNITFLDRSDILFFITVVVIMLLVWLYTNKSGIKTIVWTDAMQTFFLILAAIVTIYTITTSMNMSLTESVKEVIEHKYFKLFDWDGRTGSNFFKQFISGFLIAVAMMGLDQNMMQKSLTIKNMKDAQKNTLTFSLILAVTQFLFLGLGILLYVYAEKHNVTLPFGENGIFLDTDTLFPNLAINYLGIVAGISFLLGIIAASFSSIDSALTALTTSFTYDFLDISSKSSKEKLKLKNYVMFGFSLIIFIIIMVFSGTRGDIISTIFYVAGYTYGPLLGLFLFGMFTKIGIKDNLIPFVAVSAPILTYFLNLYFKNSFNFDFGFFNIAVNALLTILGLLIIKKND
jgi:Na+/proline symporter